MPRYVIHIGPHKTGSTYLQLAFHQLHEFLASRGILYPRRWYISPSSPNHLPLFARLQAGGDHQLINDFAQLNASKFDIILLSAEDLSDLSESAIRLLKTLVGDVEVSLVFYCRRWSETLPSVWQEWIKQGRSFSFQEFYYAEIEDVEKSRVINFSLKLGHLVSTFGINALKLVSYSNLLDKKADILVHFMEEFFHIRDFPPVEHTRVNASLSQIDTEMIRILNLLEWHYQRRRSHVIRDEYLSNKKKLELTRFNLAVTEGLSSLSINDAAPMFAALHASLFKKFGTALVNPLNKNELFEPKQRNIPCLSSDYWLFDGVVEEVREVYARITS